MVSKFNFLSPIKNQVSRLGSVALYLATQSWSKTFDLKISHYDLTANPARDDFQETCIFVFWHEYILLPTMLWGNTNVTLFVSQHRDADWLVNTGKHIGFDSIRGSTTRGGPSAIRACKDKMKTHSLGITPDGPKGPRREMALGAIYLASRLQKPIVPVGFGYERPFRLRTWDQFAIPKPGSRVRAIMGPKIMIPRKANRDELESYRKSIAKDITLMSEVCERSADTGCPIDSCLPFEKTRHQKDAAPPLLFHPESETTQAFDLRKASRQKYSAAA